MSSCSSCRLANCYQTEGLKPSTVLLTLTSQCSLWKSLSGLQGVMWWCNDTVGQLALHGASLNPRLTLCVQVRSRGRRSAWWFWIWWEVVNFAQEGLQWWRVISDSVQLPSALWINLIQFNVRGTEPPAEGSVVTLYKCQSPTLREESGIRTHSEPSPTAELSSWCSLEK